MTWFLTDDLDEFTTTAGEFLRADPAANTLGLTIVDNLAKRGTQAYGPDAPRFGWWQPRGKAVAGAFLRTPPHPAVLSGLPAEAVAPLMELLSDVDDINAESGVARAIGAIWARRDRREPVVRRQTRLYRLVDLVWPYPTPAGRARPAEAADRDLLLGWYDLFHREVGEEAGFIDAVVDDRISYGGLTIWEVDGEPVSMAGRTRPTAGMIRVGPVFTPTALRRHGYAAAATAQVSQEAREIADDVLLFTDLENPTSNAIYQRLGYRPVHDRWVIAALGPA